MGSIFLVGRMALCVLFIVISLSLDPRELPRGSYFTIIPHIYWAIGFGIGALSDLVLVLGAWKKNIGAIYTWCVAQTFFGGLVCCILMYWAIGFGIGALSDLVLVWCVAQIFVGATGLVCCILISLVAMKAVQEIKGEKKKSMKKRAFHIMKKMKTTFTTMNVLLLIANIFKINI
jgi:hypothetical protein